jgi:hypothetical protein
MTPPSTGVPSGTAEDPQGYGETVVRELFPGVMPYVVGTPATYSFAGRLDAG